MLRMLAVLAYNMAPDLEVTLRICLTRPCKPYLIIVKLVMNQLAHPHCSPAPILVGQIMMFLTWRDPTVP